MQAFTHKNIPAIIGIQVEGEPISLVMELEGENNTSVTVSKLLYCEEANEILQKLKSSVRVNWNSQKPLTTNGDRGMKSKESLSLSMHVLWVNPRPIQVELVINLYLKPCHMKNHYKLNNHWTMVHRFKRYSHWPCQRLFVW